MTCRLTIRTKCNVTPQIITGAEGLRGVIADVVVKQMANEDGTFTFVGPKLTAVYRVALIESITIEEEPPA